MAVIAAALICAVLLVATTAPADAQSEATTFADYAAEPELSQDHADVFRLYWAFFDREPDLNGARYWVRRYDACVTMFDITSYFGSSVEFENRYGALGNRGFVTLVYNNVLGRQPEIEGFNYWTALLDDGSLSRADLMLFFSVSREFRRLRPLPSDGVEYGGCTDPASVSYANCTEVREAGRAPLYRGDPGYAAHLDRDDDGVACEVS